MVTRRYSCFSFIICLFITVLLSGFLRAAITPPGDPFMNHASVQSQRISSEFSQILSDIADARISDENHAEVVYDCPIEYEQTTLAFDKKKTCDYWGWQLN